MSDMLSIGASGVRAYQNALTTVSENIANAGVAGYSRRTTDISEVAASTSTITRREVAAARASSPPASRAPAIRSRQPMCAPPAPISRGAETARPWLDQIQTALTGNKLGDQLTSFFNAGKRGRRRSVRLGAARGDARCRARRRRAFTATGSALDSVAADLDATAQNCGRRRSTALAAALAKINDALGRNVPDTSGSAQLLDQRDQLLEQMSAITDVSRHARRASAARPCARRSDRPGARSGQQRRRSLTYARSDDGAVSYAVHFGGNITRCAPIRRRARGHRRRRAADRRRRRTSSTQVATDFADGVNAVQAQGRDLDGNPGAAMFAAGAIADRHHRVAHRSARHRRGGARRRARATTAISPLSTALRSIGRLRRPGHRAGHRQRRGAFAAQAASPTRRPRSATMPSPSAIRSPASTSTGSGRPAALPAGLSGVEPRDPGRARHPPVDPRHPVSLTMQISTNQFYDSSTALMSQLTEQADKLQTQISTGKQLQAPSDDVGRLSAAPDARARRRRTTPPITTNIEHRAERCSTQSDTHARQHHQTQLQRAQELTRRRRATARLPTPIAQAIADRADVDRRRSLVSSPTRKDARGQPLFGGAEGDSAGDGQRRRHGDDHRHRRSPPRSRSATTRRSQPTETARACSAASQTSSGTTTCSRSSPRSPPRSMPAATRPRPPSTAGDALKAALDQVSDDAGVGRRARRAARSRRRRD